MNIIPLLPVSSKILGCKENCMSNAETHGHTRQFNQSRQCRSRSWAISVNRADLRERTKTMSCQDMMTSSIGNIFHVTSPLCRKFTGRLWIPLTKARYGDLMFSLICAWINGWVNTHEAGDLRRHRTHYDVTVMAIVADNRWLSRVKTKTYFDWSLWYWSSLCQLNLDPTRPNGPVDCKVPTDLVKISVKEPIHMRFYYTTPYFPPNWISYLLKKSQHSVLIVTSPTSHSLYLTVLQLRRIKTVICSRLYSYKVFNLTTCGQQVDA